MLKKKAPAPVKKMGRDVEMERVKIKTEIERVRRYKEVAHKYAAQYFEVSQKLCDVKLDMKPDCQYIMDYIKVLLEHGEWFDSQKFLAIFRHMRELKLLSDDALR